MSDVRYLRGQARRTRMTLTAQLKLMTDTTNTHLAECGRCTTAGEDYYKRCEFGWMLAKEETRARNKLAFYDMEHENRQERLW